MKHRRVNKAVGSVLMMLMGVSLTSNAALTNRGAGKTTKGPVDLWCTNFVRDKRVLTKACRMWLSNLSE